VQGGQDWALLRVRDKENTADWVANLFPLDDIDNVHIFDEVYAVGASLGHPPVASDGHISYMDDEIEHYKYWMSSAPTIFGNSGGAVYRWSTNRKQYEYIGIPSRISIQPMGFSADAITHMGYFIPIDRVYTLLDDNDYQFIYNSDFSIEDCSTARKEKQAPDKDEEE
jgi:S1-C subfamily serine protease